MIKALATLLPALWVGALIGISFIATPIKFKAPSLTLPVALDVGKVTFGLFSQVERALAIILVATYAAVDRAAWPLAVVGLVVGLVILQSVWLLPALNQRAALIISGGSSSRSHTHTIYSATEGLKLIALTALIAIEIARSPVHWP